VAESEGQNSHIRPLVNNQRTNIIVHLQIEMKVLCEHHICEINISTFMCRFHRGKKIRNNQMKAM
jgi:hypothetical protein